MDFGDKLKKTRLRLKLTQAETAEILDCATPRISEWERSVRTPKPLTQEGMLNRLDAHRKKKRKRK